MFQFFDRLPFLFEGTIKLQKLVCELCNSVPMGTIFTTLNCFLALPPRSIIYIYKKNPGRVHVATECFF